MGLHFKCHGATFQMKWGHGKKASSADWPPQPATCRWVYNRCRIFIGAGVALALALAWHNQTL
eukprot:3257163-Pyramimonas_sp.AAC.1